jgi:ABC-type bacteriocin/lantibiotic exporter with double-glycine peptidase domain
MAFTQTLPRVIQALGCFSRVQEYCNYGHSASDRELNTDSVDYVESTPEDRASVQLKGNNYRWKSDGPVVLNDPNIDINPGTIVAVVGSIGSGKTTLLESLLGETIDSSAVYYRPRSRPVAYCSQTPWLENRTIRDSIIGESGFDAEWYQVVVHACDLQPDIASQADGDMTLVGSKGVGLSGGQKQRIVSCLYNVRPALTDESTGNSEGRLLSVVSRAPGRCLQRHGCSYCRHCVTALAWG